MLVIGPSISSAKHRLHGEKQVDNPNTEPEHRDTEDLNTERKAIQTQTAVLVVIVVILAGTFAYYYTTTESQISSLKAQVSTVNGQVASIRGAALGLCQDLTSFAGKLGPSMNNVILTLQSEIQSDNSLIQVLNSTKPAGYAGIVATLKSQITRDSAALAGVTNLNASAISSVANPCVLILQQALLNLTA